MARVDTDVLNILIDNGFEKEKAEVLAEKLLTRDEARNELITKADLEKAFSDHTKWTAVMLLTQAAFIVGLLQFLGT